MTASPSDLPVLIGNYGGDKSTIYGQMVSWSKDVNTTAGVPGYEGAPAHYQGHDGIQNFDVWDAFNMDRYRASAWKYFTRYQHKGSIKNDLAKLVHYIEEALARPGILGVEPLQESELGLSIEDVLKAFELDGAMGEAAEDFLRSFTEKNPKVYLRSARAHVLDYLRSI